MGKADLSPEPHQSHDESSNSSQVRIPQPTDSPHDPLNWSPRKKALFLAIISYLAFQPDYTSASGIITIIPQAKQWQLEPYAVQQSVSANIASIGGSNLLVIAFSNYFGRLPVVVVFQMIALGTCAWCAAATSFKSWLAARILNGFFASAAQGGGLMWIQDMFFFDQHPRVINLLEFPIIISPYLGPLVTAFMITELSWRWPFWLCTILFGVGLLLILAFLDETFYDRTIPPDQQLPPRSRVLRLAGIEQFRASRKHKRSFLRSAFRPLIIIFRIPVLLTVIYYFLNFAWVISVNTTISIWLTEYYGFGPKNIGFFNFFGVIGVTIGWFVGHWMHDAFGLWYAKRHQNHIAPEARLTITYPATVIMVTSIVILGLAIQNLWHYMVLAVFASIQTGGIMIITTAVNAYLLDFYPENSGEVSAWAANGRILGGFMATYIQLPWVQRNGAAVALGIQGAITGASALIIVFLQLYGSRLRTHSKHASADEDKRNVLVNVERKGA